MIIDREPSRKTGRLKTIKGSVRFWIRELPQPNSLVPERLRYAVLAGGSAMLIGTGAGLSSPENAALGVLALIFGHAAQRS